MEESIKCPQCNLENPTSASSCSSCGFVFNKDESDNNSNSDWIDILRKTGELTAPEDITENSEKESFKDDDSETPEWLKRIQEFDISKDQISNEDAAELFNDSKHDDQTDENQLINLIRHEDESVDGNSLDWLNDFRTISNVDEKNDELPEDDTTDDQSANSSNNFELEEESTPLMSIDEIKKDWQKEFPNLSENLDEDKILPAEELPDWLNNKLFDEMNSDLEKNEEFPEWLSSDSKSPIEESVTPEETNGIPEWLSNSRVESNVDSRDEKEEQEDEVSALPEWIKVIGSKDLNEDESLASQNDDLNDSVLLFNKLEIYPQSYEEDKNLDQEQFQSEEEDEVSPISAFMYDDDEIEQYPTKPFLESEEDEDKSDKRFSDSQHVEMPFSFENIPDWLEKVDLDINEGALEDFSEGEKNDEPVIASSPSVDLPKANMPEWLKAIRPIEVVTPDVKRYKPGKKVESSGPLAGLKGVLSTENISRTYSTPPSQSVNINITDKQKTHAKILEEIITPINLSELHIKRKKKLSSKIIAILIPVFLLVIIISSIFLDHSNVKLPTNIPADLVRFHNLSTGYLNQNQESGNVLLIFEVDSSAYPEINLISAGFFETLFLNNHWITAISTNPNGVIVSEEILNNNKIKVPSYNFSERVVNLGYLPGNHLGIQSFLSNPQESMPVSLNKTNAWEEANLSEINSVADFDLIVLITDNSDNAKSWIEQIEMTIPNVGFLLISSTQSAPLLQPYLRSNQVDGMLSGISGGLAFNILSNEDTNSLVRFWVIIQIAVVAFIVLILAGGVISIFQSTSKASSNENLI